MAGTESRSGAVLVTGGAGFIGSHLTDHLLAGGDRVVVIDDLSTGSITNIACHENDPAFEFVEGDVCDTRLLREAAEGCDRIYHLAAIVGVQNVLDNPLQVVDDNIQGTRNVLEVARRTGAKVFIASTSEVYGRSESLPFHEDGDSVFGPPQVARWNYAVSKSVDEMMAYGYASEWGLRVVVARFFNTIGRRQIGRYGMVVPQLVGQALSDEPLTVYGSGEQTRTFCDVRDVVRAVTLLMSDERAEGRPFNIGSTREISIDELARLILRVVAPHRRGDQDAIRYVPFEEAYPHGHDVFPRRVPDVERLSSLTGWDRQFTLEDTLTWIADSLARRENVA